MNNKYPLLSNLFKNEFSYELQMGRQECNEFLIEAIEDGVYDLDALKKEVELALADKTLNWVQFAVENKFLWDETSISNADVINELKYYAWDVLYPESEMSDKEIRNLISLSLDILDDVDDESQWVEMKDLYKRIEKLTEAKKIEYYQMNFLLDYGYTKFDIKSETGKGKDLFYFRKKKS